MEETNLTPLPAVSNPQVLDMSFCYQTFNTTSKLGAYKLIPRFILAALLLILAVARLCMDLYQEHKATKQWKVNQYINLLVRDGGLYFLANLFNNINFGQSVPGTVMTILTFILMFTLPPRFMVDVRELFARSLRVSGRSRLEGVDAGFGISSSRVTTASSVGFADLTTTFGSTEGDVEMRVVDPGRE